MNFKGDDVAFAHIGVFTENLAATAEFYSALGYKSGPLYSDEKQNSQILLLTKENSPMIELVAPINDSGPDTAAFRPRGLQPGAYHTCYEVTDLESVVSSLTNLGFRIVVAPVAAVAFQERRISYLWSRQTGLIEFLEARKTI